MVRTSVVRGGGGAPHCDEGQWRGAPRHTGVRGGGEVHHATVVRVSGGVHHATLW